MVDIKEKYKDLQPLPCGIQDFEKVRTNGLLYADKTEYVYKLANDPNGEVYFLGRPRRFGKSLFLSTLECYFNARKDLFEGLKIMELEQKWTKYGGLDAASEQIADRKYAAPFLTEDKELLTFAIEFDSKDKELKRWNIEKVNS